MKYTIAPSILSANFADLGNDAQAVLNAGADMLHFDVMDNHFVPNLTVGPLVCQALRDFGIHAPIDVHLMVKPVNPLISAFIQAGASIITFHPSASDDIEESLALIQQGGCQAGLAINPDESLDLVTPHLHNIQLMLLMSVNPGFAGQAFIPEVLDKVTQARKLIQQSGQNIQLSIDGGINADNIKLAAQAGADTFVAGSAIFKSEDYKKTIDSMRDELKY